MERKYAHFKSDAHPHRYLKGWEANGQLVPVHLIGNKKKGSGRVVALIPKFSTSNQDDAHARIVDLDTHYVSPDYDGALHREGGYIWVYRDSLEMIQSFDSNQSARILLSAHSEEPKSD